MVRRRAPILVKIGGTTVNFAIFRRIQNFVWCFVFSPTPGWIADTVYRTNSPIGSNKWTTNDDALATTLTFTLTSSGNRFPDPSRKRNVPQCTSHSDHVYLWCIIRTCAHALTFRKPVAASGLTKNINVSPLRKEKSGRNEHISISRCLDRTRVSISRYEWRLVVVCFPKRTHCCVSNGPSKEFGPRRSNSILIHNYDVVLFFLLNERECRQTKHFRDAKDKNRDLEWINWRDYVVKQQQSQCLLYRG